MAEALAMIGLASSIATFIDLGLKIVRSGKAVFNSASGKTDEAYELGLIVEDIDNRVDEMLVFMKSQPTAKYAKEHREKYNKNLRNITAECKRLAKDLQNVLLSLAVKKNARFPMLEASRITLKSFLRKDDIEALQARLERLETRLRIHVTETMEELRYQQLLKELQDLKVSHDQHSIRSPKLDSLHRDLQRLTRNQKEGNIALSANLTSLSTKLARFQEDHKLWDDQLETIKSLYFPELRRREFDITDAHTKTEKWLYVRNRTTFSEWLEGGNGIYWIQGLAGSGKSTLMKFLCNHPETLACLDIWAGGSEIYTASFFFWNQGHTMQKSLHGLIQSLAYQILRKMPDLIPELCGSHMDHEPWEFSELKMLFRQLLARMSTSAKFCFFIHGLDEYSGNAGDVVEILKYLVRSKNIKICASSRPWPAFEEAFTNPNYTLVLQDFTRDDMEAFVRDIIADNSNYKRLVRKDPIYEELIASIATRARGVWLWVFLVSRDLKEALDGKEDYTTLEKILDSFPPDLSAYFEAIIQRLRPVYREDMAKIFLLAASAVNPLPLYAFNFIDEKWYNSVDKATEHQIEVTYRGWKNRLHNRCGDLLTIRRYGDEDPVFVYRVDFLHRTARDWLIDTKLSALRQEIRDPNFNNWVVLCKMLLCLMKALPISESYKHHVHPLLSDVLSYAYDFEQGAEMANSELSQILDRCDWFVNSWFECNFLALAVEAGLVGYVRSHLEIFPDSITKSGRRLLRIALCSRMHSNSPLAKDQTKGTINIGMVALLLENGVSPYDGESVHHSTVWRSFLDSCSRPDIVDPSGEIRSTWLQATQLLVEYGVGAAPWGTGEKYMPPGLPRMLNNMFGTEETVRLLDRIDAIRRQGSWGNWVWEKWKQVGNQLYDYL